MFNVNDYKISRAIVALEREVNYLKISNTSLINNNYYTKDEIQDKFVINDYENTLSFTNGTISNGNFCICYGNGMFVTIGKYGNNTYATCAWSTDGKTFTDGTFTKPQTQSLNKGGMCYGKVQSTEGDAHGIFVAVGQDRCAWSIDGKTFTEGTITENDYFKDVCYGNDMFVAVGRDTCAYSTDGKTFTSTINEGVNYSGICYGLKIFVAVGNNKCAWSTDGKTFTEGKISSNEWTKISFGFAKIDNIDSVIFVAVGNNKCAWSQNGKVFFDGTISDGEWRDICYGNNMFVAVGNNKCAYSIDGKTFIDISFEGNWYSICYGSDKFVTVGLFEITKYAESKDITAKSFALKDQVYTKAESNEKFAPKEQSHTITHLCPVDESEDINSFVIGKPLYMTGNVYVKQNNKWKKSMSTDSIDCISSVKTSGTWREYLGICTHILPKSKEDSQSNTNESLSHDCGEIKFASHGDYMIKVSNSSEFKVGDIVYLNENSEGKLEFKVLTEDVVLTAKINKLTIGMVTGIIDETTLSVFKE